MKVSACIATRGDVTIEPLLKNYPHDWEVLVWDNGAGLLTRWFYNDGWSHGEKYDGFWQHDMSVKQMPVSDLGPHGRFAAIEYASHDIILTQDDDVIVSDPQAIVNALLGAFRCKWCGYCDGNRQTWCNCGCGRDYNEMIPMRGEAVVCNLPQEFRPHYPDSAMVGFGAAFHRDAPQRAFNRYLEYLLDAPDNALDGIDDLVALFLRESCRLFTVLTPRVLVDVAKTDMPYASDPSRLWKQPGHVESRDRMLELARQVRDA